jgi:hypothetical protein
MSDLDPPKLFFTTSPGVLIRPLGDEAILLDPQGGNYFALNPSGYFIWTQIQAGKSQPEIVASMAEKYAINESQAKQDMSDITNALIEANLIGRSAQQTAAK